MFIEAHLEHQARALAARHQQMQVVSVMHRPWLAPHDCLVLTWQQMTKALSWRQVVQIMVSLCLLHFYSFDQFFGKLQSLYICLRMGQKE